MFFFISSSDILSVTYIMSLLPRLRIDEAVPVILKNEMGGACSTYGEEDRCIQGFGGET
jgi:hypothetical protein